MYTRASASDWDDFNTEGWRAEQLIPYMRNFEDYQRPCQNPEIHGMDGEIASSFGGQIVSTDRHFSWSRYSEYC